VTRLRGLLRLDFGARTASVAVAASCLFAALPAFAQDGTAGGTPDAGTGGATDAPSDAPPKDAPTDAPVAAPPKDAPLAPKPPEPTPPKAAKTDATAAAGATKDAAPAKPPADKPHQGSFEFGSYGRVVAAANGEGDRATDADIVEHGSRLDEDNYAEIELRREDDWEATGTHTDVVFTLAIASPVFHYSGDFDVALAVRNLYLEGRDLGVPGLSAWAGSRMVRGDDIYVLDYWPLDNLNLLGAGVGYKHEAGTSARLAVGATQPNSAFFNQKVLRPAPLDGFGAVPVELLDRQKLIGSLRIEHDQRFGPRATTKSGIKGVLYGEGHVLPDGERETKPGTTENLPSDGGFVVGGEVSAYTGERSTYVSLFVRYASGLAAYGQFATPGHLSLDKTTDGAREILVAAGGNAEYDFFGTMVGAYFRSFRDASEPLDYEDVDEGAVVLRPTFWFGNLLGASLEGSFELAQRGVLAPNADDPTAAPVGPAIGSVWRIGIVPFVTPAGRGNFTRPQIRLIYDVAFRDAGARALYPQDHPFATRSVEHFIGFGAEWWFNSSSYGN